MLHESRAAEQAELASWLRMAGLGCSMGIAQRSAGAQERKSMTALRNVDPRNLVCIKQGDEIRVI